MTARWLFICIQLALVMGCRDTRAPGGAPPADARLAADARGDGLRDDLVPALGSDRSLDIATWNIEDFPKQSTTTFLTADLIASLRLDVVAVQEIGDIEAFEALVARLPDYEGVLSDHVYSSGAYQKLGLIYRSDLLEVTGSSLLFESEPYELPRPPLQVELRLLSDSGAQLDFAIIALHLKAGTGNEDARRRKLAIERIESHVRAMVEGSGTGHVVLLGDFNEVLDTATGQDAWSPLLFAPERYQITTQAASDGLEYSFLPGDRLLDHIVTTSALSDELAGRDARIPRIDMELADYERTVSDHLPVVISMPIFSSSSSQ